jgi:RNA methyltransferase, TrmH family
MISQAKAKLIHSLQNKKIRTRHGLFLVEGTKNVLEVLNSEYVVMEIVATEKFAERYLQDVNVPIWICDAERLQDLGTLEVNDSAIAMVRMVEKPIPPTEELRKNWVLALEQVRDPGNLGTIIRIADWYGIDTILCNEGTAELYNPKVIQASMGSFTRVGLYYCDLASVLPTLRMDTYGATMDGISLHQMEWPVVPGVLVMGNESHGLSPEVLAVLDHRVTIPRFGRAESLNVGVATAVCCDAIRRTTSLSK